jgi:mRNA interferase RelE/StbE
VTYTIELTGTADKFLTKLARQQPKDAEAIEDAIEDLADIPRPTGCKALAGYTGVTRIRVGNYRVCYTIDAGQLLILVITISNRADVYEVLRRHLGH